jgi:uncharacterized protein
MIPEALIQKYYSENSELCKFLLNHSLAVANKAVEIVRMHPELAIDERFVYEAAMLHDIGILKTYAPEMHCFGVCDYLCHGYLGAEMLRQEGLERHARVCERHTGSGLTRDEIIRGGWPIPQRDMLPETLEEKVVCFADKFYSKSKPEKEKSIENIRKSMAKWGEKPLERFDDLLKLFYGN